MMGILSDFLVRKGKSYYCKYGDFYIDPLDKVECAIISHGHGDHATPGHSTIFTTPFTVDFMKYRFPKFPDESYHPKGFNEPFVRHSVEVRFIPAGHILGSAQILMIYQGIRYLYTGDYKMQEDPTCEPIEYAQADVLITETTFANPEINHPNPENEIKKLNEKNANILLGAYTLGKAQRLTALINLYCPDRTVLIHHRILPVHRLYEKNGHIPLRYKAYSRSELRTKDNNRVYIVPPLTFNSSFRANNLVRVFASGWERLQQNNDLSLYISDHVDWSDLLAYIELVNPSEIWTVHGDGKLLERHFSGRLSVREIHKSLADS